MKITKVSVSSKAIKLKSPLIISLGKIEYAMSAGVKVREACLYAGIKERTYYHYCEKYPDFLHRMTEIAGMRELRAKLTIYANLKNVDTAKWYLEKKHPDEFGNSIKFSGKIETTTVTKDSLKSLISDIIELKKLDGVEMTEDELMKQIEGQLSGETISDGANS